MSFLHYKAGLGNFAMSQQISHRPQPWQCPRWSQNLRPHTGTVPARPEGRQIIWEFASDPGPRLQCIAPHRIQLDHFSQNLTVCLVHLHANWPSLFVFSGDLYQATLVGYNPLSVDVLHLETTKQPTNIKSPVLVRATESSMRKEMQKDIEVVFGT